MCSDPILFQVLLVAVEEVRADLLDVLDTRAEFDVAVLCLQFDLVDILFHEAFHLIKLVTEFVNNFLFLPLHGICCESAHLTDVIVEHGGHFSEEFVRVGDLFGEVFAGGSDAPKYFSSEVLHLFFELLMLSCEHVSLVSGACLGELELFDKVSLHNRRLLKFFNLFPNLFIYHVLVSDDVHVHNSGGLFHIVNFLVQLCVLFLMHRQLRKYLFNKLVGMVDPF